MSEIDVDALRKLLAEATPGPWEIKEDSCDGYEEAYCPWHKVGPLDLMGKKPSADGLLVRALRNNADALLSELTRLRRIEAAAREYREWDKAAECGCYLPPDIRENLYLTRAALDAALGCGE